jgi:ribosomal protein S18 acetylase RimI-like enzyme
MYCDKINKKALTQMPNEYSIRNLYESELESWKALLFDNNYTETYKNFMDDYYNRVYKNRKNEFYDKCIVICDKRNEIIGTCFLWKLYGINTLHWLKVRREYTGMGIGRALISKIMENINKDDFPIFLHTQPESYRAIKLYSDFGFKIITNKKIGNRMNNTNECKIILKEKMPKEYYKKIKYKKISSKYLKIIDENKLNDF